MSHQSQGEVYPRELEDAFKLCRIANAVFSDPESDSISLLYLVNAKVHEPIGPDNFIWIEDFENDESITVKMLEDRIGPELLTKFWYKRPIRNA
jgi:hypothetical protein